MLNFDIKRKINNLRDILVGKVPDPKAQVEQITIALIYKFMDDMDLEAIDMGGERDFFKGDKEKYSWTELMSPQIGGQERVFLFGEGLEKLQLDQDIPPLFRDIFKGAFLPYRDPQTLNMFLKEINDFKYDHSEELGNAFEYLLSIMGSQGDAGQFRTPRHIIDMMVEIIEPKKHEKVLDPACGTAGFLISSYKHILNNNLDEEGKSNLTADDRRKLVDNFVGYDISPEMVRLSKVNMYLHRFRQPKIYEYDTLTTLTKWDDQFDVILANPPFMTPKGGIVPHNRFRVQAKRSEVLFVDYIAEHLTPTGRAAIIVPEGIVFQSANAYKDLRRFLIEDGLLYGVISLPSGIFNPYSGVKTSILLLDKTIAKQTNNIIFIKLDNDGFDLGAQRRAINNNDIPRTIELIKQYQQSIINQTPIDYTNEPSVTTAAKTTIANQDYTLVGERYKETITHSSEYPMVELGEVCEIYQPKTITNEELLENGKYPVFGANGIIGFYDKYNHDRPEIAITCRGATCGTVNITKEFSWITGNAMVVSPKNSNLNKNYLFYLLKYSKLSSIITGTAQPQITRQNLSPFLIPLPPLEVQEQIVAEIEGYQKIIDGARQVVDSYKPNIMIDPKWKKLKMSEIIEFVSGVTLSITDNESKDGIPIVTIADITEEGELKTGGLRLITTNKKVNVLRKGDLLFNWRNGSMHLVGKTAYFDLEGDYIFASFLLGLRPNTEVINSKYLWLLLNQFRHEGKYMQFMRKNVNGLFNRDELKDVLVPIPTLELQEIIIDEYNEINDIINKNKTLILILENKIENIIKLLFDSFKDYVRIDFQKKV